MAVLNDRMDSSGVEEDWSENIKTKIIASTLAKIYSAQ